MTVKQRPVNLDLTTMHFPITAIVSILHRISGVGMLILLPWILWMLAQSLQSADAFAAVQSSGLNRLVLWLFFSALLLHLYAGIRHLRMDMGYGESLPAARDSALKVIVATVLSVIFTGIWLWL